MQKVAVLGSGQVGEVLANGFLKHGYAVMRGTREPSKLQAWKTGAQGEASVGTFAEAAAWGEVIVLAVKGTAAESVVELAGPANLAGKLVIDTTNPIGETPPKNGAIQYFTGPNESLFERLHAKAPKAKLVKAFNSVGSVVMVNPKFPMTPSMFICGNDAGAKQQTAELLDKFGWEAVDVGGAESGQAVEALCILWCAPGFLRNDWAHAFKYMKPS